MSSEGDVRKLLKLRAALEVRSEVLEEELGDLKVAMAEIDRAITSQGFRQSSFVAATTEPREAEPPSPAPSFTPTAPPATTVNAPPALLPIHQTPPSPPAEDAVTDSSSVQAKDGTVLGRMQVTEDSFTFTPREGLSFTTSTPPWQSFLIERVLASMKTTDEGRAATGEIPPEQVLTYAIETEGEVIKSLTVRNFGGERRLREIQSSLRWSLDKMYDKMRRG